MGGLFKPLVEGGTKEKKKGEKKGETVTRPGGPRLYMLQRPYSDGRRDREAERGQFFNA